MAYRTEDTQFVAYLHAQRIKWLCVERNRWGRTEFVFDITEDEALRHRTDFANSMDSRTLAAFEFVTRTIHDMKRNREP